jgi:sigma-B regulation protein RsbU (phosphoserine phosphatase)
VTGPVLGVLDDATYEDGEERLEPGELLLLFTDGLTEAQASDQELYGDERVVAFLAARLERTPAEICAALGVEIDLFEAGQPADDLTLVALRRV